MKKIDWSVVAEIAGIAIFTAGVAMISVPLALMAVGAFFIWAIEKADK